MREKVDIMKTYVKPEIYFESFELSQHIAACGWYLNSNDASSCTAEQDGAGYIRFNDANQSCEGDFDYCYTGGGATDTGKTHQS